MNVGFDRWHPVARWGVVTVAAVTLAAGFVGLAGAIIFSDLELPHKR